MVNFSTLSIAELIAPPATAAAVAPVNDAIVPLISNSSMFALTTEGRATSTNSKGNAGIYCNTLNELRRTNV